MEHEKSRNARQELTREEKNILSLAIDAEKFEESNEYAFPESVKAAMRQYSDVRNLPTTAWKRYFRLIKSKVIERRRERREAKKQEEEYANNLAYFQTLEERRKRKEMLRQAKEHDDFHSELLKEQQDREDEEDRLYFKKE